MPAAPVSAQQQRKQAEGVFGEVPVRLILRANADPKASGNLPERPPRRERTVEGRRLLALSA